MSQQFDLLWNNIMSNQAPGLSAYEKSLFLTQAQKDEVIGLYNGSLGASFEATEEQTHYLAPLVKQASIEPELNQDSLYHIVSGSTVFKCPADLMFRTYESCELSDAKEFSCDGGTVTVAVIPTTQDDYWRTSRNPFRGANKRKVLRLAYDSSVIGSDSAHVDKYSELISKYTVTKYTVRYVKFPEPIILEDLPNGLLIDGKSTKSPCLLNDAIHDAIVLRAVNLAKAAWK